MVYGGPDGELGASLRYLSQRYSMPYPELKAILTDVGISVAEMHPLMGQGFVGHEVRPNCDHTSVSEMFLTKCTSCVEGISVAEMHLPLNSMTDKPYSGILIHTVRSNEVLARYSKKNQFDKDIAPKKKESRHEITIRIFV